MKYFFIQMGGTIDKDYPKKVGGYAFEIAEAAATRIMPLARSGIEIEYIGCTKKDSLDINDNDRRSLENIITHLPEGKIVITHGTDTIIETGKFLEERLSRPAVLTGSMVPERFKNSDAHFNLGMAVATAALIEEGVYIAIQGIVKKASEIIRNTDSGLFQ